MKLEKHASLASNGTTRLVVEKRLMKPEKNAWLVCASITKLTSSARPSGGDRNVWLGIPNACEKDVRKRLLSSDSNV
jgi:hypothetical protein